MSLFDMAPTEFLERLADAMDSSRGNDVAFCVDECGTAIKRGIRCDICRKKRHAAAERARAARKKNESTV